VNLTEIANIVEIVGIFAILYGLYFGSMQLKQDRIQRRDLAILECTRLFEDEEFTEAYRLIQELPAGITSKNLSDYDDSYKSAAVRITMKFETIGMLVHRGVVPLNAMEDLVRGAAIDIWGKLEHYIRETRQTSGNPNFMEWYQWLVDRMKERNATVRQPAFEAYADWREPEE